MWIVFVWLFFQLGFETILILVNLRYSMKQEHNIPAALQDVISPVRYQTSKSYLMDNSIFSVMKKTIAFISTLLLLFWIMPFIEKQLSLLTKNYLVQGLVFFALLFLYQMLLSLPFSWFENFRIEKKYGFNRMTYPVFWSDQVKNIITSLLLGILIIYPVLLVIQEPVWWWKFTLIVIGFFFVSLWIGPVILMPLFNKFTPIQEGELKDLIHQFTEKNKIPVKKIFVMDASKRSTHGNAFFTGIGFTQRLVLFDTILSYPHDEILSIIGHEWGHWKHLDIWRQLLFIIPGSTLLFSLANYFYLSPRLLDVFSLRTPYALLYVTMMLVSPVFFFIEPIMNYLIRIQEFSADAYSAKLMESSQAGINGLKKLIRDNLSNLHPHPLFKIWYYSHPAPEERIQALEKKQTFLYTP